MKSPGSTAARIRFLLSCVGCALPLLTVTAYPSYGADRVYVTYGVLGRSISVASLKTYAKEGVINDEDLAVYAQYANPKALKDLRNALVTKADITQVTVAQFLYSPQGEAALKRLGQVIQPESGLSGFKAIRAALILAAADPDGLTLLNFLEKFPSRGIRINIDQSLNIVGSLNQLISQTKQATGAIAQLATAEIATDPRFNESLDLRKPGAFGIQQQSITLTDSSRSTTLPSPAGSLTAPTQARVYPVDIYLPIASGTVPLAPSIPVVVISHGLGSDRTSFAYLARHLTSHGFAVLVPEHPGSSSKQMEALLQGVAGEVAEPTEFANRPLDITYLLNYLEQQAATNSDYQRLDLKRVGVIGQSFGGYTALALAGAPINFEELRKECRDLDSTFNISLLLQCRAQQLETGTSPQINFRDPRVVAIVALNPIDSAVMGQSSISQITIPTLMVTGTADTVAPAIFEQIRPFTWLSSQDKYLVQMEPGTHFSTIGGGEITTGAATVPLPPEVIGPNPAIAQRYTDALALAFFGTYVANQVSYRPYLSAAYAKFITEPDLRLSLVRSLTASQITRGSTAVPQVAELK